VLSSHRRNCAQRKATRKLAFPVFVGHDPEAFREWICGMRRVNFLTGAIGGTLFAFAVGAAEITALPDGPNRDLVSKMCQSCHDLQMVFDAAGIGGDEWNMSLDEMTANGMNISADDRAKILVYLSTYLGPSPPKPATSP
jgi:hypothetical protein